MKIVAPAYYKDFNCIADKCRHSCCIGWEISVDDDALNLYRRAGNSLGEEICRNISYSSDGAQFITGENKKCPFLMGDGLCRIIKEEGDDWLCQICRDHPRFRNYFSDRVEIGIGMCCEEAARLIISAKDASLEVIEDDDFDTGTDEADEELFEMRDQILGCIHDENTSFLEVTRSLKEWFPKAEICGSPLFWHEFLNSLEYMDVQWHDCTSALSNGNGAWLEFCNVSDTVCKNIFGYFLLRHLPKVFEDYSYDTCISFCLTSTALICYMFANSRLENKEKIEDFARMYSCEIEYSDENTYAVLDMIEESI